MTDQRLAGVGQPRLHRVEGSRFVKNHPGIGRIRVVRAALDDAPARRAVRILGSQGFGADEEG
jgi:hypothetical protein